MAEQEGKKSWGLILGVGLVALFLFGGNITKDFKFPKFNLPSLKGFLVDSVIDNVVDINSPVDEPREEIKEKCGGYLAKITKEIRDGRSPAKDSELLHNYFKQFRDYGLSNKVIDSPAMLKKAYVAGGHLYFDRLGMKDRYPNLAEYIDGAMKAGIGTKTTKFDEEKKQNAKDVIGAIAWACYEGGK